MEQDDWGADEPAAKPLKAPRPMLAFGGPLPTAENIIPGGHKVRYSYGDKYGYNFSPRTLARIGKLGLSMFADGRLVPIVGATRYGAVGMFSGTELLIAHVFAYIGEKEIAIWTRHSKLWEQRVSHTYDEDDE